MYLLQTVQQHSGITIRNVQIRGNSKAYLSHEIICDRIREKGPLVHFEMRMFHRCVSLQLNVLSKLNIGRLQRRHYCSNNVEMKP